MPTAFNGTKRDLRNMEICCTGASVIGNAALSVTHQYVFLGCTFPADESFGDILPVSFWSSMREVPWDSVHTCIDDDPNVLGISVRVFCVNIKHSFFAVVHQHRSGLRLYVWSMFKRLTLGLLRSAVVRRLLCAFSFFSWSKIVRPDSEKKTSSNSKAKIFAFKQEWSSEKWSSCSTQIDATSGYSGSC